MSTYPPDPIPMSEVPRFKPYSGAAPQVPAQFSCVAVLHPFAPPPEGDAGDTPFYELCTANIVFSDGAFFSLQILTGKGKRFWYMITPDAAQLSVDGGSWQDMAASNWSMPTRNWLVGRDASCAGIAPINWLDQAAGRISTWWKYAIPGASRSAPPGATWLWFDAESPADAAIPRRVMFGVQPPTPTTGDGTQLAVLQNFSFSYFLQCSAGPVEKPSEWSDPVVQGFQFGNPKVYQPFAWQQNQGITVFMTPVNEDYDPLPTRVLYRWDPDQAFQQGGHRGQSTLLHYDYPNKDHHSLELALLTRVSPDNAAKGYNAYYFNDQEPGQAGHIDKKTSGPFPFGTQPPDWVKLGDGAIHGTLSDNGELGAGQDLNIWGVMFPPAQNYPQGTYLWTWYAPQDDSGVLSRPVTFMQSASALGVGTSLALADYFYFEVYDAEIDAAFFEIPPPDYLKFS